MPTKPKAPGEPTTLAPFKEIMRQEKAYPAEVYVSALKRMDELIKKDELTMEDTRESIHCARAMAACLATYRVMPEIFESTLAFPPQAYLAGNDSRATRLNQVKPLIGENRPTIEVPRAPRPSDA